MENKCDYFDMRLCVNSLFFVILSYVVCLLSVPVYVEAADLGILSLDELLDLEVVSVAKVPEKVVDTPAAIQIITAEDLRRNNIQSIPEALRMVPGMHVYQIDANKWAVGARGFASKFANKMLVMIDGRTVYSPLFSGVFWDVQDTMIEDIERIEVIRGPGGTLWGANAVNGVMNIITKDSADTQGSLSVLRAETSESGEVSARYGGWLNGRTSYRIYGKFFDRGNFDLATGEEGADGWHAGRGGFRMDMNVTASNKVTLQGDLYDGKSGESSTYITPFPPFDNQAEFDAPVSGGNILGRWTRTFSKDSELIFQTYYDHTERDEFFVDETIDTADFDLQHRLDIMNRLEILWGLGYRFTRGDTVGKEAIPGILSYNMNPKVRKDNLFSGFLQGRLPFAGDQGEFTLGTKLEHNDYTDFEWQPSARLMWSVDGNHSVWAAISRSVRTPSRLERDADVNVGAFLLPPQQGGLLTFVRLMGNDSVESETIYSYEVGYRGKLTNHLFFDLSLYYNKYNDLINGLPTGAVILENSPTESHLVLPVQIDNGMDGETYGAEISCGWSVTEWWRLTSGYTWFQYNTFNEGDFQESRQGFNEDENAHHLISLVSYLDLPHNFELNSSLYYVSSLDGPEGLTIDPHISFDLNVGWHPTDNFTVSIGGRNLFNDAQQEFSDTMDGILATEIPRTFYGKITITY